MPFVPQYSHDLDTSVALWLDNKLLNDGQGYINITGLLYPQNSPVNVGYAWASPFKSWVYDSSVNGAVILSGVYTSSGQFLTRSSGLVIDYINGRVISPYNWGSTLSGIYARKQVNVYFSTEEETNFYLENVFQEDTNIAYPRTGNIVARFNAPCIILTNSSTSNKGFALGGLKQTDTTIRCFIISDNNYMQEGIGSLLTDVSQKYIPLCSYSDAPIGTSGDLKGLDYNYITGIRDKYGCGNAIYIENSYAFKMNSKANKNTSFALSMVELDLNKVRMT
jgi:hypothetical protein